jgi:hypothetical protein
MARGRLSVAGLCSFFDQLLAATRTKMQKPLFTKGIPFALQALPFGKVFTPGWTGRHRLKLL